MMFKRWITAAAVAALSTVSAGCTDAEGLLFRLWANQAPDEAAEAVATIPPEQLASDQPVLSPEQFAALTEHVRALEALPDTPRDIVQQMVCERWGCEAFAAIDYIIMRESSYNPFARNRSSGACGIPQALPCSKLPGFPWDVRAQVQWMFDYIDSRYGGPWGAYEFKRSHGWY